MKTTKAIVFHNFTNKGLQTLEYRKWFSKKLPYLLKNLLN